MSLNQPYDNLIVQPPGFVYPTLVKDLWLPNQKRWNETLIDLLFTPDTTQIIKQTIIINSNEQDYLCWELTPNGICHAKSAYYACLQGMYNVGEDRPSQPSPAVMQLMNQVWKSKAIIPRIQTFAWRFLCRALPTGARAGKFSKHIGKLCCRCGMEENDIHLFFTCPSVKASWFLHPWFIRTELIVHNCNSLAQIILNLLNINHPHVTLPNILTFLWCIWKSRNDEFFQRRSSQPYQISINANALSQNLELCEVKTQNMQEKEQQMTSVQLDDTLQGSTITTDRTIIGNVVFCDASWKCRDNQTSVGHEATGIGVYLRANVGGNQCSLMIQASASPASSAFQAEVMALLLAATLVRLLNITSPIYFSDNQLLAKVAASRRLDHPLLRWDSRNALAEFLDATSQSSSQVYHIKRDYNEEAHKCANQARRHCLDQPIFTCTSSAHVADVCPVVSVLQSAILQGFVLHVVLCN